MKVCSQILILVWGGMFLQGATTFQEQASRLQNINAYLLDLRPTALPERVTAHRWELAFELTPQPDIDNRQGRKQEQIDPPEIAPRLRFRFHSRGGFFAGATYVPGIEFRDYDADYLGLELGWRFELGGLTAAGRISYTDGEVIGPITEADVEDFFAFENRGLDFSLGKRWRTLFLYSFIGINDIDTRVEVAADGALLRNQDDTWYAGLAIGLAYRRTRFLLEQNVTDDYLKHLVLSAAYRF